LAIGELLADFISQEYVEGLEESRTFSVFQGGSPANVCANVNWLGEKATLVSCVGNDGIGKMLLAEIRKTGLDTSAVCVSESHPTSIVLVGRSRGTPDFIAYRMADTQIPAIDKGLITSSAIVHSCAFALSAEPARSNILHAFAYARSLGKLVSVDWNFAPSIWGQDNGQEVFRRVCSLEPLLKFSMDDMERFTGISSVNEAKAFLESLTCTLTCLTMGKDGVWFRFNSSWEFLPAEPVSQVLDTTGAGDAFWSGVLTSWNKRNSPSMCISEGLRVAALKVQKMGPLYK
jgi:fructokinase